MRNEILRRLLQISLAADSMLEFIKFCRGERFKVGRHTIEICARLDKALEDYKRGISSYLIVTVPFRHGKSEIISRHFPAYAFGSLPNAEILLVTYAQSLSTAMSRDARNIFCSERYRTIFPNAPHLNRGHRSVESWGFDDAMGKFQAIGIMGAATGKGSDILIVDDYLSGRADAESETIRQTQWDNFAGNLFTRLAPVHIAIILATPWHVDDIIGRITNRTNPLHKDYEPNFPKFERLTFPARSETGDYLFPERFTNEWYEKQFAMLGNYQAAALLQCSPKIRGGNMFQIDKILYHDTFPDNLRFVRFWDLASTEKERTGDNPDYTSGALVAAKNIDGKPHIFIKHVAYCQQEAPERNKMIINTAEADGRNVPIGVESVAGYKDAYTTLKSLLYPRFSIKKVTVSKDKVVRASILEPLFEAGNVHILRGMWNIPIIEQLTDFPSGAHDDHVDAIAGAYELARKFGSNAMPGLA